MILRKNYSGIIVYGMILLFMMTGITAACFAEGDVLVLTLERALEIALNDNKDVKVAHEEIQKADARIREARSVALPNLSVNNIYTRNLKLPAFFLTFDNKITKIVVGSSNSVQSMATLAQPIWVGGKVGTALKIAKIYSDASDESLEKTKKEVIYQVKQLYYGILLSREAIKVTRQTYEQADGHYKNVKSKFEQGSASEFDLLRAEVEATNLKPQVIQAENRLELLQTSLKNLLAINPDQEVKVEGQFTFMPLDESILTQGSKEALNKRSDLRELELTSKMMALNVKIERAGWFPSLYLTGTMQFMGQTNDYRIRKDQRNLSYDLGLQLQVPIFDGLRTSARVEQAEIDHQKMMYQIEKVKDGITTEARQAVLQMREANQRVSALVRNVEQAEKANKIAVVRYGSGIGTQLELFDAQVAREMAQMNYLQGVYDYLIAQAAWEKAVGR